MSKHKGTVKFFKEKNGYGFIAPDDKGVNNGADVFVHIHDLTANNIAPLEAGQKVLFEIGVHRGKSKAINLEVVQD